MIIKLLKLLISLPKILYVNFKFLPLNQAKKLPILISYNTTLDFDSSSKIIIKSKVSTFMIKYNFFGGSKGVNVNKSNKGSLNINNNSKIIFNGSANFSSGISIRCDGGTLYIGNNFSANNSCFISCSNSIEISDNCLIGWDVSIRDSDGHVIYNSDEKVINNKQQSVTIKENTWIGSKVDILKGSHLAKNTIVGYNSCVTKAFEVPNTLIAGYPASVKKRNVTWIN